MSEESTGRPGAAAPDGQHWVAGPDGLAADAREGDRLAAREPGRLRFRTETGSVYELTCDGEAMRWARTSTTLASGVLGIEGGSLGTWPAVLPGYRAVLSAAAGDPEATRGVTSRVVAVLEGEVGEPLHGDIRDAGLARGDLLLRDLAGVLVVLPYLGTRGGLVHAGFGPALCWTFDEATGAEVDDELGWGPAHGRTGSRLVGVRRGSLARRAAAVEAAWARVVAAGDAGDSPEAA